MDVGDAGARWGRGGDGRDPLSLIPSLLYRAKGSSSRNMNVDALSNSSLVAELGAIGSVACCYKNATRAELRFAIVFLGRPATNLLGACRHEQLVL